MFHKKQRNMKNAFTILLLIGLPFITNSQTSSITINLADTIHVVGEEFIYMISSYSGEYEEGMPLDNTPVGVKSELEIWLKAKSIAYEANDLMGYGGAGNGFYLKFKSLQEMEAVTKDLKSKIGNTMGWLVQVNAPESERQYDKLLEKLMQKAKLSAEQVAKKMGKQNIAISEVNFTRGVSESGGNVYYPALSGFSATTVQDPMQYIGGNSKGKVVVGGTLEIKYLAN
jgi:hypothetical protein